MKLSDLKPGQKAVIKKFEVGELSLKLLEMGCLPGENILIEQVAPMGGPISVCIAGYSLSLRLQEAEAIIVETIDYQ